MYYRNRSLLLWIFVILVSLALTIGLAIIAPFNFNRYFVDLVTTEGHNQYTQDLWYQDLDQDGRMERIELFEEGISGPRLVVISNGIVVNQWDWKDPWFPSPHVMAADVTGDNLKELFVFTQRSDSVFGHMVDFRKNAVVLEFFVGHYPVGLASSDLHIQLVTDKNGLPLDGQEQYFLVSGKFSHASGEILRINFDAMEVLHQDPGGLVPTKLYIDRGALPDIRLVGNFSSLSQHPLFSPELGWTIYNRQLEPIIPMKILHQGLAELQTEIVYSGDQVTYWVLIKYRDRGSPPGKLIQLSAHGENLGEVLIGTQDTEYAYYRNLDQRSPSINKDPVIKDHGFSVRCIRDASPDDAVAEEFTDPRDSVVYPQREIAGRIWMTRNLQYQGDMDVSVYQDNPAYDSLYGRLYTWDQAMMACPPGWHLPTDVEFQQLEVALGANYFAYQCGWRWYGRVGRKLQTADGWMSDTLSNLSRFSAIAAGAYDANEGYRNLGTHGYFWVATEKSYGLNLILLESGKMAVVSTAGIVYLINDALHLVEQRSIPPMVSEECIYTDLDGDAVPEFAYFQKHFGGNLIILKNNLKQLVRFPVSYENDVLVHSIEQNGAAKDRPINVIHTGRLAHHFTLEKNATIGWSLFLLSGFFFLLIFTLRLLVLLQERETVKKEHIKEQMAELQLKAVSNQFNPHFTFNLLSTLTGFLQEKKPSEANELVGTYAKILRRSMLTSSEIQVPLSEEISAVQEFLELERIRMEGAFQYDISISEDIQGVLLPKSLIMTFVENGIKHGTRLISEGGKILIKGYIQNDQIRIDIMNNGYAPFNGHADPLLSTGNGLKMVHEMVALFKSLKGGEIDYDLMLNQSPDPTEYTIARIVIRP